MNRFKVEIAQFTIRIDPSVEFPLNCEYLSDSYETVIRTPFLEPLVVDMTTNDQLTMEFQMVELRLSEEAIRQMFEALPPEMLH